MPDGQPLVWALKLLGHAAEGRVRGLDLVDRARARAARAGQRCYLYGGRYQGALAHLARELRLRRPDCKSSGG